MRKTCCDDCNAMTITLSCCRKLHKLEPRHYCNSISENICNKSAAKHHLKGNFCPRKVWENFLHSQQSFLPISSPEPIRHFFLPELSTKQSSYFSNSTFSGVSPDYHIIFILIWTFLHKKLWDVINRLNEGAYKFYHPQSSKQKTLQKLCYERRLKYC